MPDYSNPNTKLTASRYAFSVTAFRPAGNGTTVSQQIDGSYTPPSGATVKNLLEGFREMFAKQWKVPVADVTIASYSLREK